MFTSRSPVRRIALVSSLLLVSSCFTGPRPSLETTDTIAPVQDPAARALVDLLATSTDASFTIEYDVVTKFGGLTTTAIVAIDPILGKSVEIGDTRFLYTAEGTTSTCTVSTGECSNGIDETRVSDRQLTSTFFAQSAMERIRQDARVAVGPANGYASTTAERATTCADFTVVDSTGASRTKTYCAFDDLSVIAVLDTADLSITATTVTDTIDTARFQPPG